MDAGRAYNTWPLMGGRLVPEEYLDGRMPSLLRNSFENTAAVQFHHRWVRGAGAGAGWWGAGAGASRMRGAGPCGAAAAAQQLFDNTAAMQSQAGSVRAADGGAGIAGGGGAGGALGRTSRELRRRLGRARTPSHAWIGVGGGGRPPCVGSLPSPLQHTTAKGTANA